MERTVSPGKAIIRFTSISLGFIGELIKREREIVSMKPKDMKLRRTVGLPHRLSCTHDVFWLRRDQRGLSLSRGKSRDSRWAEIPHTEKRRQKKTQLNICVTHLHTRTAHVLDGIPIMHKCHVKWGPVQDTKRPFQGRSVAHILFRDLEQLP